MSANIDFTHIYQYRHACWQKSQEKSAEKTVLQVIFVLLLNWNEDILVLVHNYKVIVDRTM